MGSSSSNLAVTNTVTQVTQDIKNTCNTNTGNTASLSNVQVDLTDIDCTDVNVVVQDVNTSLSCAISKTTFPKVASLAAKQLKAAQANNGGAPVTVSMFGTNISSSKSVTSIAQDIKQAMSNQCGNGSTASSVYSNVSVSMDKVSCSDLNVLMQRSSFQSICSIQGLQAAMDANPQVASATPPDLAETMKPQNHLGLYIGAALLLLVVVAILVGWHVGHKRRHQRVVAAAHAQMTGRSTRAGHMDMRAAQGIPHRVPAPHPTPASKTS